MHVWIARRSMPCADWERPGHAVSLRRMGPSVAFCALEEGGRALGRCEGPGVGAAHKEGGLEARGS
jgi:hypothetical protein